MLSNTCGCCLLRNAAAAGQTYAGAGCESLPLALCCSGPIGSGSLEATASSGTSKERVWIKENFIGKFKFNVSSTFLPYTLCNF